MSSSIDNERDVFIDNFLQLLNSTTAKRFHNPAILHNHLVTHVLNQTFCSFFEAISPGPDKHALGQIDSVPLCCMDLLTEDFVVIGADLISFAVAKSASTMVFASLDRIMQLMRSASLGGSKSN